MNDRNKILFFNGIFASSKHFYLVILISCGKQLFGIENALLEMHSEEGVA